MPWHPPIPASKLYSEPALKLGPALALLVWCYDRINRDGTIEIKLESAATDIGKPYGTIRDWWRMLREGPFFSELTDKGRRGWAVRMDRDWIDWHVMGNNYPVNAEMSAPSQRRNVSANGFESSVTVASTRRDSRDVSDEGSAYKVLQDDQNPGGERKQSEAHSPAVKIYFEFYPNETLDANQIEEINKRITDLPRWKKALRYWTANKHRPRSIGKICDRYDEEANGHKPTERAPPVPTQTWKPPDDALSGAALQEAIAARTKKRE